MHSECFFNEAPNLLKARIDQYKNKYCDIGNLTLDFLTVKRGHIDNMNMASFAHYFIAYTHEFKTIYFD